MIKYRLFSDSDANEVADLVATTMKIQENICIQTFRELINIYF